MDHIRARSARRAISLFQRAAKANYEDVFRKGNVVLLPKTGDLLITADIHGNATNFKKLLNIARLQEHTHRHMIFQELIHSMKPYRDAYDFSFILLEWLAALKLKYPNRVHIVLGNHDHAELTGLEVHKFGRVLNPFFIRGLREAYGKEARAVHQAILTFLGSFNLACRTDFGLFVSHSFPGLDELHFFDMSVFDRPLEKGDIAKGNSVFNLVWGRDLSARAAFAFCDFVGAEVLVVGHNPCEGGYSVPNQKTIILDSKDSNGCYILLPLSKHYTPAEVVEHIKSIY